MVEVTFISHEFYQEVFGAYGTGQEEETILLGISN